MAKDDEPKKPEDAGDGAGPMLDMSQAAVKKMIATAKARGYITYDELNEVLPPEQGLANVGEMRADVWRDDLVVEQRPQHRRSVDIDARRRFVDVRQRYGDGEADDSDTPRGGYGEPAEAPGASNLGENLL